mgnify:CR=1 FL=1
MMTHEEMIEEAQKRENEKESFEINRVSNNHGRDMALRRDQISDCQFIASGRHLKTTFIISTIFERSEGTSIIHGFKFYISGVRDEN